MRRVPYVDFAAQFAAERSEVMALVEEVFGAGEFVGGGAIAAFEEAIARTCGVDHAVALNSGTDALSLGLKAAGIGPGDEVITAPNSFIASAGAIVDAGARPVFADVLPDQNIDPAAVAAAIGPRTRAIMPVHLTGRVADMDPIMALAERHALLVIEDAAQAIGSRYRGRMSGAIGHVGCFSTHPLKNLNAAGDGGILVTGDAALAERVRRLRNHGLVDRDTAVQWGRVSRMDTLQAALLIHRLGGLDAVIERRRANARAYRAAFDAAPVFVPPCRDIEFNTFHSFVVQVERRDALKRHLAARGVETAIHYPRPIHLQPVAKELGYAVGDLPVAEGQARRILSLPIHQFLAQDDIRYVAEVIASFLAEPGLAEPGGEARRRDNDGGLSDAA
ncbi:MAG: DegT/DnrJ/EryC1/StrS family aminotransferase [Alphaproteobacteria bacterium]